MWKDSDVGHVCSLPKREDSLFHFFPGSSCFDVFLRGLRRSFTISENSTQAKRIFKSKRAIETEQSRHLGSFYYIIHPYSVFREIWEPIMMLVYLAESIVIPLYMCFSEYKGNYLCYFYNYFKDVDNFLSVLCLADIVVNLSTGYASNISPKTIELSPWKILGRYLSTYLLLDLVTTLPIEYIACVFSSTILAHISYIRLLKIARFLTFREYFYRASERFHFPMVHAQIICFAIANFLLLHYTAAIYYQVTTSYITKGEETWTEIENLKKTTFGNRYYKIIFFVLFNLLNLNNVFGVPASFTDKVFSIIFNLLGSIVFLVAIGCVMRWSYIVFETSRKYEEVEQQLNIYMRHNKLPRFLQRRIKNYYDFRFQKRFYHESKILSLLSTSLRQDVLMYSCRRLVQNVSFFSDIPHQMLVRVVVCMHAEIFLINDVIVKAGAKGNSMYFITSGTVAVYSASGKEICHLENGAHFGEVALVVEGSRRVGSVVAIENCELQRLDRSDFRRVLAPYPDLAMRLERIAEQRLENSVILDEVHRRTMRPKKRSSWI